MIPEVVSLMKEDARRTEGLITRALAPEYGRKRIPKGIVSVALVLLNYQSWASLRLDQGCSQEETAKRLTDAICKLVET